MILWFYRCTVKHRILFFSSENIEFIYLVIYIFRVKALFVENSISVRMYTHNIENSILNKKVIKHPISSSGNFEMHSISIQGRTINYTFREEASFSFLRKT